MVKFAHIADAHLGGWKEQQMQDLNFDSFVKAIDICLKSDLDFILFAGDLFDSAYPPIEILKETFAQFKRLQEAKIPCFIIAGSHDYSVSGKTFLDVLEKAGFCKNVFVGKDEGDHIYLDPVVHENIVFYGYPGRKSGLEVPDIRRLKLNDAPGMFKIFMLHTTLDKVVGDLPIDSVESAKLPNADYYALGHIHVRFSENGFVYPGPIYPNNFRELEDLHQGSFVLVDTDATEQVQFVKLPTKPIEKVKIRVTDGLVATEEIMSELDKRNLEDKVVLLRVVGELERGKKSDIKFSKIQELVEKRGAYFMLKNTHDLKVKEIVSDVDIKGEGDIEEEIIKAHSESNPSDFNTLVDELMDVLSVDKQEDEKIEIFNSRLLSGAREVLKF